MSNMYKILYHVRREAFKEIKSLYCLNEGILAVQPIHDFKKLFLGYQFLTCFLFFCLVNNKEC